MGAGREQPARLPREPVRDKENPQDMLTTLSTSKLAAIGVAGVLTLTAAGGTAAYAQSNHGGAESYAPAVIQQAAKEHPRVFKHLMADVIKESGLSKDAFKDGFKNGKSINDILTANGKDPAAVKTAVLADVDARIQQALTDGKINQAQATKLTEKAPTALEKLFAATRKANHPRVRELGKAAIKISAETIGITPRELVRDLRGGQTIAQVAGGKTQAVIDALVAHGNAAIDKAHADGKISEEQAEKLKANLPTHVQDFVNNPHTGHKGGNAPANSN